MYGDLRQDVLDITIESSSVNTHTDILIEMPLKDYRKRGYESNLEYTDSLIVNNIILFEVYFIESN